MCVNCVCTLVACSLKCFMFDEILCYRFDTFLALFGRAAAFDPRIAAGDIRCGWNYYQEKRMIVLCDDRTAVGQTGARLVVRLHRGTVFLHSGLLTDACIQLRSTYKPCGIKGYCGVQVGVQDTSMMRLPGFPVMPYIDNRPGLGSLVLHPRRPWWTQIPPCLLLCTYSVL